MVSDCGLAAALVSHNKTEGAPVGDCLSLVALMTGSLVIDVSNGIVLIMGLPGCHGPSLVGPVNLGNCILSG